MAIQAQDLGPFAPSQGARSRAAVAAVVAAAASAAFTIARMVADGIAPSGEHGGLTTAAGLSALLAIALGIGGLFDTATRGRTGRSLVTLAFLVAIVAAVAAFVYRGAEDGTLRLDRFATAFFDLELLGQIGRSLARGALNTMKLAFAAEVLSLLLGMFIATLHLSKRIVFHVPAVLYVDIVRGTPLVVLAFLIYGGLPKLGLTLDPFVAGVIILMINGAAYTAEIFRAGLQAIPRGQHDAARSLGLTQGAATLYVIIPQAVRTVIPPLMSDFIALLKDTALVTLAVGFTVASADLFGVAKTASASTFSPTPFIGAAMGYLAITIPLSRLVGFAERKLRAGLV